MIVAHDTLPMMRRGREEHREMSTLLMNFGAIAQAWKRAFVHEIAFAGQKILRVEKTA